MCEGIEIYNHVHFVCILSYYIDFKATRSRQFYNNCVTLATLKAPRITYHTRAYCNVKNV